MEFLSPPILFAISKNIKITMGTFYVATSGQVWMKFLREVVYYICILSTIFFFVTIESFVGKLYWFKVRQVLKKHEI